VSKANGKSSTRVHRNLERAVLMLTLLAGLPGGLALLYILWQQHYSFEVRWTVATVVGAVWIGSAALAYQMVTRILYLQANLLGALREGDYSIRGTGAEAGSAVYLVMQEINALGDTLQRQRTEAVESTRLLHSVMAAIDVAVFAFDMDAKLVLVNPAAERLIGRPAASLLGLEAQQLRLAAYLITCWYSRT
jgi:two-component system nitrogen regulation sensor histidine kinase NtrY